MHKDKIHTPVLLKETIEYLNIGDGNNKTVIDATLDGGGHATVLREQFPGLRILGIEFDPVMAEELELDPSISIIVDSYANIEKIADEHRIIPDAVYFDLGVSSWHYESASRGFTFQRDQLLDMRFNPEVQKISAIDVINRYTQNEIEDILIKYGEEEFAKEIAKNMNKARKEKPVITTTKLVEIIDQSVPIWYKHKKIHFATKTFQAIRIEVNNEIETIKKGLNGAINILKKGGRLVVISFHGLEDKTVKDLFKSKASEGIIKFVTKDTIKPKWLETRANPRSRSAKMKIVEKL
ncbi:MAG: Ribosomal RNA small subunit methyltransferase H [Parcubacteria group bacterium GW2011_GWC1_39_29]|nr:MAG: Ribosomal RNA small subunit methyltransferase H [Parcubacteria group bacterium GW2011_GWC1_39_29]